MANKNDNYRQILNEMLELSGIPLDEAESEDDNFKDDIGKEDSQIDKEVNNEKDIETDNEVDKEEDKEEKEKAGEINDKWESKINSKGDFKIEFYENFAFAYYKGRRSNEIKLDSKLKPYKKMISEFVNKIFDHIEKKS